MHSQQRTFSRAPNSTIFGVDLEEHLLDMRTRVGVDDVPFIIGSAVDFLTGRAASTPGLFRQTVENEEQRQLRAAIESTYVDRRRLDFMVLTSNVHAVGAMLKAYLKELPRPLLSTELYPYFLAVRDGEASEDQSLRAIMDLLARLPPCFFLSAKKVCCMLQTVARQNPIMKPRDLSKIFAPLVLRSRQFSGNSAGGETLRAEAAFELMILHANALFEKNLSAKDIVAADPLAPQMGRMNLQAAESQWYYIDAAQNYVGPVATSGLLQLKSYNYVTAETYVWASHLAGWMALGAVPELQLAVPPPVPAAAAPPQAAHAVPQPVAPAGPIMPSLGLARNHQSSNPSAISLSSHAPSLPKATPAPVAPVAPHRSANISANISLRSPAAQPFAPVAPAAQPSPAKAAMAPSAAIMLPGSKAAQKYNEVAATAAAALGVPQAQVMKSAPPPPPLDRGASALLPDMEAAPEVYDGYDGEGMRLLNADRKFRALIMEDGTVQDSQGTVLGFIEPSGDVGNNEMDFLGHADPSSGLVTDRNDKVVGEFDQGRGYIKNAHGSVTAEVTKEGTITGNGQQTAGFVQGFTFQGMVTIAAYVLLVDPTFTKGY